ncbi:ferrochelatase, partial [Stutzerimonas stutzeri]|uniref:ferrochelatase n=1 Tax=Stutzerimonas stutzeri TaxID=316 RepID=UPI001BD40DCF
LRQSSDPWQLGYQTRHGRERWLQPYAEPSLWAQAESGVKQIDVVCPGFATDCLETLEEVALGFTETLAERGAAMRYIPCLNADAEHARALAQLAVAALA